MLLTRKQFVTWFAATLLLIAQLGTVLHATEHMLEAHDDSCQAFVHAEKHHSDGATSGHTTGVQHYSVCYKACNEFLYQKNSFLKQQPRAPPVLS